jgi:hypothetical protein
VLTLLWGGGRGVCSVAYACSVVVQGVCAGGAAEVTLFDSCSSTSPDASKQLEHPPLPSIQPAPLAPAVSSSTGPRHRRSELGRGTSAAAGAPLTGIHIVHPGLLTQQ